MKRWIRAAMALLMTVTLAACGQTGNGTAGSSAPPESENSGSPQTPATESASPVPTESSSSNDPEIPGTTSDGNVLVAYFSVPETFAYNERAEDARPELATQIENLDSYDVIFLFL